MRLVNGSRVAIVGGGPAGSFMALHLLRLAAQASLHIEVIILEGRDFSRPGLAGCNKCAGILSSTLLHNMRRLDLSIPAEVIQAELDSYVLHLGDGAAVTLSRPDASRQIVSVYRGSGPLRGEAPHPHSFDQWLLEQAQQRGALLRRSRVRTILRGTRSGARPGGKPTVITARESLEADLVVLATGVNGRPPLDTSWGYQPPKTETMAQDEVIFPPGLLDKSVHIFMDYPPGLVFGGLIPKGRYVNVSLLGRGLAPDAVKDFLEGHANLPLFPEGLPLICGCTPRVAISPARRYYADQMVAVGDAAVTRLYKDGIGSAFSTAEAASRTAIRHGISRQDFGRGYVPHCRQIASDNLYGRLLFKLWVRSGQKTDWLRPLLQRNHSVEGQLFRRALWAMFTGDEPYRQIFWLVLKCLVRIRLGLNVGYRGRDA